jgi:CubicO group peptidase (beta-lactamase class C family)
MAADAIFRIASMTKPVTSVAALQLIERGRISLDAPVSKYLPELSGLSVFESFDSASGAYTVRPVRQPITLRNLLTHTSGLGYNFTSATVRDFKPRDGERIQLARFSSSLANGGTTARAPTGLEGWLSAFRARSSMRTSPIMYSVRYGCATPTSTFRPTSRHAWCPSIEGRRTARSSFNPRPNPSR